MEDPVESESHDDDEVDDIPAAPRGRAAKKGAAKGVPKGAASQKDSERKKRELITLGRAKGFLTSDEVTAHMPESVASPEQMDDWLSALADEGIEIVESPSKGKVPDKGADGAEDDGPTDPDGDTLQAGDEMFPQVVVLLTPDQTRHAGRDRVVAVGLDERVPYGARRG